MNQGVESFTQSDGDEQRILAFLDANPDLFLRHPDILAKLELQHDSGQAVSLIEHQLKVLREQNFRLREELAKLVELAQENDALNGRLHQLTLGLIDCEGLDEVLATLHDELLDQFKADAVEIKLFPTDSIDSEAELGELGSLLFKDFLISGQPFCGPLEPSQLEYLFGDQAGDAGSVALIPIEGSQVSGVLAIGSRDTERFRPEHGTDFLRRLSEIVSHTLQVANEPGV